MVKARLDLTRPDQTRPGSDQLFKSSGSIEQLRQKVNKGLFIGNLSL